MMKYKCAKTTHTRTSVGGKEKGSKVSKGEIVEVQDVVQEGDVTWLQLDSGKFVIATRGTETLFHKVQEFKVTVIEARSLLAKDDDGTSDPFFRFCIEDAKKKHGKKSETEVINNTLNPTYAKKNVFNFSYGETDTFLFVECYDKDMLSKDLIGTIRIPLEETSVSGGKWYELQTNSGDFAGEVYLRFGEGNEVPESEETAAAAVAAEATEEPVEKTETTAAEATEEPVEKTETTAPVETVEPETEAPAARAESEETRDLKDSASETVSETPDSEERPSEDAQAPMTAIEIFVHSAEGLPIKEKSVKPYVEIGFEDSKGKVKNLKKTEILPSAVSPKWEEALTLPLPESATTAMRVEVHDKDMFGSNLLGKISIPYEEVTALFAKKTFALKDKKSREAGEIVLSAAAGTVLERSKSKSWATKGIGGIGAVAGMGTNLIATTAKKGVSGATTVANTGVRGVKGVGNVAATGVKGVGNVAVSGAKGVGSVASAGVNVAGNVASTGVNAVGTVASAGVKGVGTVASAGVKGVGAVASTGVKGATFVASTGFKGVRMIGDAGGAALGAVGLGGEEEGQVDLELSNEEIRRKRAKQLEEEAHELTFIEWAKSMTDSEKEVVKFWALIVVVYWLIKLFLEYVVCYVVDYTVSFGMGLIGY